MKTIIDNEFDAHIKIARTMHNLKDQLAKASDMCITSLKNGGKIVIFGNGGSAADAQHIAAELVGHYKIKRKGLAAIALTTDTSALTSISNDFGYDMVFARQLEALVNKNDIIIAISTSGNSQNVLKALQTAKKMDIACIGFSGNNGGKMNDLCDINLAIASNDTARIQEMHILIGHILCHLIENK